MKTLRNYNLLTAVVLFLVMAMAQVNGLGANPKLTGRLKTHNNKPVLVNGNKVASGTTVFSGVSIQSPEGIGATVDLGSLGRIDIAPKTTLTLTFSDCRVSVTLDSGYVILTTNKCVNGTIVSEGKTLQTDPSKPSSLIARTAGSVGPETAGVAVGAGGVTGGGISAGGVVGILGGVGAAVGAGAAAAGSKGSDLGQADRGQAVSPSRPR